MLIAFGQYIHHHGVVHLRRWLTIMHHWHPTDMRNAAWIWFAGFIAWIVAGLIGVRTHAYQHAQLDFLVAMVFLAAAFFYRRQQR
jgi:hypothetical protein